MGIGWGPASVPLNSRAARTAFLSRPGRTKLGYRAVSQYNCCWNLTSAEVVHLYIAIHPCIWKLWVIKSYFQIPTGLKLLEASDCLKKEVSKGRGSVILKRVLSDPAGVLTHSPGQVKKNGESGYLVFA